MKHFEFTTRQIGCYSTVQDIVAATVTNRETGETRKLTKPEYDRFFDNRDPAAWTIEEAGQ